MAKKKLLIVESPSKIKTINKFLGNDFKIMSTVGHIIDLPPKKIGITINDSIELEYTVIPDKKIIVADLCKAASTAEEIFLATDPDREGEIISWHVENQIKKVVKNKKSICRISFNEITETAILQAIKNKSSINLDKVAAQQARRVLDRWVGFEVSPILWNKITKGLSAGRVQSVALRLVYNREKAIKAFKPEEYWSITNQFNHQKSSFEASLVKIGTKKAEIKNEATAKKIVSDLKEVNYTVTSIADKKRAKNPLPPFMTSTLQQAGFNRLGMSVKGIMQIAQKLYEGMPLQEKNSPVALITYMRTDSVRISETAQQQARSFIKKEYASDYLPTSAPSYAKGKKSAAATQDAHEAIRPIDIAITPEIAKKYLPRQHAILYTLIWQRFVASQMKAAQYAQRSVTIQGGEYTFKITGSTLIFDGFLKVYKVEETENEKKVSLPAHLSEKDSLDLKNISPKQHFTQAPPKYTEGSLVKELEKEGIGRPSTWATILNTIQARSYVTLDEKKRFAPTELGSAVTEMLVENLPDIMDFKFTAEMEESLDKIARGELKRDTLLKDFYATFSKDLEKFSGKKKKEVIATDIACTKCTQGTLVIRFGKNGEFLGCNNYPECKFTCGFTRTEDNKIVCQEEEPPEVLDESCPTCEKPLRQVRGKFGPFKACSGYPECKYIHREIAHFPCPKDNGEIVKRRWRGGTIWGCANYPKCKFCVFGDIIKKPCLTCKLPFLVQKKKLDDNKLLVVCSEKTCDYTETIDG